MVKTWCPQCHERQFLAGDSGLTCANGHGVGFEEGLIESEAIALGIDTSKRLRRKIPAPKPVLEPRPTIAKRSAEEAVYADATCTPKWFADFLLEARKATYGGDGKFDLDPCSNERSWIHARWSFSLEKGLDGLKLPWVGETFKNNPFSHPILWQEKARYELSIGRCTELVELCKMDPSTKWWPILTEPVIATDADFWEHKGICYSPDLWLLDDRMQYDEHPLLIELRAREVAEGKRKGRKDGKSSNNFCSVVIHHRFDKPPLPMEDFAKRWVRP